MTTLTEHRTLWQVQYQRVPQAPTRIRIGGVFLEQTGKHPALYYLVSVGFFKILRDLDVLSYYHTFDNRGLAYYLEVNDSRSAIRAYLQNLKEDHMLGAAWDLSILDSAHTQTQIVDRLWRDPMSFEELQALAEEHMSMGSRPLRFSRYFLYAALAPFGRERTFGSSSMQREDAHGERSFYEVIQGIEILMRSFAAIDFSGVNSYEELRSFVLPLEGVLSEIGGTKGFLKGLLFHSALLKTCYEKKIAFDNIPDMVKTLSEGLEKDFRKLPDSDGLLLFHQHGLGGIRLLAIAGYQPIIENALPFLQKNRDLEALSLFLLAQIYDTTTITDSGLERYLELQKMAGGNVHPDLLNALFFKEELITDGISDLISLILLLDFLQKEE